MVLFAPRFMDAEAVDTVVPHSLYGGDDALDDALRVFEAERESVEADVSDTLSLMHEGVVASLGRLAHDLSTYASSIEQLQAKLRATSQMATAAVHRRELMRCTLLDGVRSSQAHLNSVLGVAAASPEASTVTPNREVEEHGPPDNDDDDDDDDDDDIGEPHSHPGARRQLSLLRKGGASEAAPQGGRAMFPASPSGNATLSLLEADRHAPPPGGNGPLSLKRKQRPLGSGCGHADGRTQRRLSLEA